MQSYTGPHRGAIALGIACALGAAAILVEDVRHSHEFSVDHLMSLLVLTATIGAGHMGMEELRSRRLIRAVALGILFGLGTVWCVKSTSARIAEVRASKAAFATSQAAPRRETERELATAREAVQDARTRADKACKADPNGEQCRVWGRRQQAYQSQVNEIIRGMGELAPDRTGREGTRYTAQLAALLTGGTVEDMEARLGIIDPALAAVLLEFGTIAFFGIGLSRSSRVPAAPEAVPALPAPSQPPLAVIPARIDAGRETAWVREFKASKGRRPTIAETQLAFPHLARSTAHRRIQAA